MKASEFRKLIREEIRKVIKEEESFGDDIAKQIQAERLAQQRKFIAWAKAAAAKKSRKVMLSIGGVFIQTSRYVFCANPKQTRPPRRFCHCRHEFQRC